MNPLDADVSALEAYGAQEAALLERSEELRRERDAKREAREAAWAALNDRARHLVQHPEEVRPEELSRDLIDRVFLHSPDHGYGKGGSLVLGGLSCHKSFDYYVLNSGKTRRTTPLVWWFDAEGKRHGDADPDPVKNRRSDPDRNWGLGRD